MEFTMVSGAVPPGSYAAEFAGAEIFAENVERFGEGVLLRWRIIGGEHDGEYASRICSAKLTPKSNLAKFAVALKGQAVATGERFSFDAYRGVRGKLMVEPTESGGSRVSVFLREQPQNGGQAQPSQVAQQDAPRPTRKDAELAF